MSQAFGLERNSLSTLTSMYDILHKGGTAVWWNIIGKVNQLNIELYCRNSVKIGEVKYYLAAVLNQIHCSRLFSGPAVGGHDYLAEAESGRNRPQEIRQKGRESFKGHSTRKTGIGYIHIHANPFERVHFWWRENVCVLFLFIIHRKAQLSRKERN